MTTLTASPSPATAPTPLWIGPRLLVPMTVEALIRTELMANQNWSLGQMNYSGATRFWSPIEPNPLTDSPPPPLGVTVHWAMPDALTNGVQPQGSPEVIFPFVPNRWLITRTGPSGQKAWVIQSDYLGNDGTSPFLDPDTPNNAVQIGKVYELANWNGEAGQAPFLKATGTGYATFVSYIADINNVFSFQDTRIDQVQGPLNYTVMGWYANPDSDPLYASKEVPTANGKWGQAETAQWLDMIAPYRWTVGTTTGVNNDLQLAAQQAQAWLAAHGGAQPDYWYPGQVLCHGMVYDVPWTGNNGEEQSGFPRPQPGSIPDIAIGNSTVDALSAYIDTVIPTDAPVPVSTVSKVLEAFQYDLLTDWDNPSGEAVLNLKQRKAWFGATGGGTTWEVVNPRLSGPDGMNEIPPPLSEIQSQLLSQLNTQQAELERLQLQLTSMQSDLYSLWWKVQYNDYAGQSDVPADQLTAAFESTKKTTQEQINTIIPAARSARDATRDSLCKALGGQMQNGVCTNTPQTLQLMQRKGPRYWTANDPVLLISGAGRSYKYGEDGRFSDDDSLFCRFTGQTITGLQVTNTTLGIDQLVTATDFSIPVPDHPFLPKESSQLSVESFFLDTNNALTIALKALQLAGKPASDGPELAKSVAKQQTLSWNSALHPSINSEAIASASGLQGTVPSKVAVELWGRVDQVWDGNQWQAERRGPWSPIYLDWNVTYFPAPSVTDSILENWTFDGEEFAWSGPNPPAQTNPFSFTSRTFLTPAPSFNLAQRIDQFLTDFSSSTDQTLETDIAALSEFKTAIGDWDVLSQSLSGFNESLAMRTETMQLKPDPDVVALLGNTPTTAPLIASETFYPIRAGHFILNKMWVVDSFGETYDPIHSRNEHWESFQPLLGTGLSTPGSNQLVQLPPRIVQPSRLNFTLVSASDDGVTTDSTVESSPVCGWVLPNHLDGGLSVYDAVGKLLGELLVMGGPTRRTIQWQPVPGGPATVGTPPQIKNKHLLNFVNGLLLRTTDAEQTLTNLLSVIDETLWTVNPLGGRDNQNLSILVGRPLAVVRATLGFELQGGPIHDQSLQSTKSWSDWQKPENQPAFTKINFPVCLGSLKLSDDGLLGYFLNDDYNTFNSVHPLTDFQPSEGEYIRPIGTPVPKTANPLGVNYIPLQFNPGSTANVTMLLDPRGKVYASTGVLPAKDVILPALYVEQPLAAMQVTFRTGPVLEDQQGLRLPQVANIQGAWSWIERSSVTDWETVTAIVQANDQATFPDEPPSLAEGWLKLSPKSPGLQLSAVAFAREISIGPDGTAWVISSTVSTTIPGNYVIQWYNADPKVNAWVPLPDTVAGVKIAGAKDKTAVVVTANGEVIAVTASTPTSLSPVGAAQQVSVGLDGTVWVVTPKSQPAGGGNIVQWLPGITSRTWTTVPAPAAACEITGAGANTAWTINSTGDIRALLTTGLGEHAPALPAFEQGLPAMEISYGADGTMWVILAAADYEKLGGPILWLAPGTTTWQSLPQLTAIKIAGASDGTVWTVAADGQVWHANRIAT